MALLPEGDHYGLIWTMTPACALQLAGQNDREFLAELAPHRSNTIRGPIREAKYVLSAGHGAWLLPG